MKASQRWSGWSSPDVHPVKQTPILHFLLRMLLLAQNLNSRLLHLNIVNQNSLAAFFSIVSVPLLKQSSFSQHSSHWGFGLSQSCSKRPRIPKAYRYVQHSGTFKGALDSKTEVSPLQYSTFRETCRGTCSGSSSVAERICAARTFRGERATFVGVCGKLIEVAWRVFQLLMTKRLVGTCPTLRVISLAVRA